MLACRLFNPDLGVGFHLIQSSEHGLAEPQEINPRSDHLSFQSECLAEAKLKLTRMGIPFIEDTVVEGGIHVTQGEHLLPADYTRELPRSVPD